MFDPDELDALSGLFVTLASIVQADLYAPPESSLVAAQARSRDLIGPLLDAAADLVVSVRQALADHEARITALE